MDSPTRSRIADVAQSELSDYGKHPRISDYWRVSGMPADTHANWCGAFVLWVLRTAGVSVTDWVPGVGFIAGTHLKLTTDPRPGDILYKDQPWQHESVVVARNGNTITTIDGNSPLISANQHVLGDPALVYYSIESLPSAPAKSRLLEIAVGVLVVAAGALGYRKWRQRKAA